MRGCKQYADEMQGLMQGPRTRINKKILLIDYLLIYTHNTKYIKS